MGTNFTNQIRNSLSRGCYVFKQRASARLARVEAVSRRRRCSRLTFSFLVTVQPWAKKRKVSWRLLKIENQLLPPIPRPLPPALRGGKGNFFCGVLQAGVARLQNPCFFSPPPRRRMRRRGGGRGWAKATAYKGSSIAVELPDARLNNARTFSFLNDVPQHLAAPRKMAPNGHEFHESVKVRELRAALLYNTIAPNRRSATFAPIFALLPSNCNTSEMLANDN